MNKIAIVVHGGAGPDSEYIRNHKQEYKQGIKDAVDAGYDVLAAGGSAVEAVEAAVRSMEDNPLFNAGKGAALNEDKQVELCASIMDGKSQKGGAVAIIKAVKNPVSLAKVVMEETDHMYLGETGAMKFAKEIGAPLEREEYFLTEHNLQQFEEKRKEVEEEPLKEMPMHGTVGAVALDQFGNLAAATSTGGTEYSMAGRIGDSSMVGVGTYANNETCAISTTGDGEYNIRFVSAFHISALMEYKGMSVKEATEFLVHEKGKDIDGDIGLIGVDRNGDIALSFNSDRMHRGWRTSDAEGKPEIY
jgi:L-asparaginase / beta-aspartyl-peptidase